MKNLQINQMDLAAITDADQSIDYAFRLLASSSTRVRCPGIVIVTKKNKFYGILTDGDFRNAYLKNINFDEKVLSIVNTQPRSFSSNLSPDSLLTLINLQIKNTQTSALGWLKHIVILDEDENLVNIINYLDLVRDNVNESYYCKIYGMGYVGLTLAVSLASLGDKVVGIDINTKIIDLLRSGISHIHEPGLEDILSILLKNESLSFHNTFDDCAPNVHIVCVGTPITNSKPNLSALESTLSSIASSLKIEDIVILRSTVPVGTTRDFVIPYLESNSGMKAGVDFSVLFCPERTVEGNALNELKELPQVIGGFSKKCVEKGFSFWSRLCNSVNICDNLEASELVKLANNSFRDLSFAFSNELALIADSYNIDASNLVKVANDGYPRNKIPLPSPGVGGYCLTKDPILYNYSSNGVRSTETLNILGRKINDSATLYPSTVIDRFISKIIGVSSILNILIIGVAFKGKPETSDIRGSTAVDLFSHLVNRGHIVATYDFVVSRQILDDFNLNPKYDLSSAVYEADAVIVMNNHYRNSTVLHYLAENKTRLIFDGWSQFNFKDISKLSNHFYATMGFNTLG